MAFIANDTTLYSFADYDDVLAKDKRLFDANESLTQTVVEDALVRSTARILNAIRGTEWWKTYYRSHSTSSAGIVTGETVQVPAVDGLKIQSRQNDFTDLCVYHALNEYVLPSVADFGDTESSEVQKIAFYGEKYRELFREIVDAGDWYDFDGDDTIEDTEKYPVRTNLVRVR